MENNNHNNNNSSNENNNARTYVDRAISNSNNSANPEVKNDASTPSKIIKDDKGVSNATLAAGIIGGAIAGTAAGTAYSEEIKSAFAKDSAPVENPSVSEANVVSEINSEVNNIDNVAAKNVETDAADNEIVTDCPDTDQNDMSSSSVVYNSVDESGNVYSVSFFDIDGDDQIDYTTAEVTFVDGSNITYTEFGGSLEDSSLMALEMASPEENSLYCNMEQQEASLYTDELQTHEYIIQPGDTLSEIAAENNTSIENLMELNPEIENPDLIYAGSTLVIPNNDNISNPYEVKDASNESGDIIMVDDGYLDNSDEDNISSDDMTSEDEIVEDEEAINEYLESEEYEADSAEEELNYEADNGSDDGMVTSEGDEYIEEGEYFEESGSDDFNSEFEQTDFESYNSTDNYIDDSFNNLNYDY